MMATHRRATLAALLALAACGGQARGPGGTKLTDPTASASLFDTSGSRSRPGDLHRVGRGRPSSGSA